MKDNDMQFPLLAMAANMEGNAIFGCIVLIIGAFVLRRFQPAPTSDATSSWLPPIAFFAAPAFGAGVVLLEWFVFGQDDRSIQDAFKTLPAVLVIGLVVGTITAATIMTTQRKPTVIDEAESSQTETRPEKNSSGE